MTSNSDKPIKVQIDKGPLWKRIISHPFRYYGRMMGITFCLVNFTNLITSLFDKDRQLALYEHPEMFGYSLLAKSAYFGLIWPQFYLTAIMYPKNAFILGGGLENAANG